MKTTAMAYTTDMELKFLNSLGLASLQAYLAAATQRTDGGAMDAQQVLAHCRKRIEQIQERSARR